MILKMLTTLERRMDKHTQEFQQKLGTIKKTQTKLKNTITEIKNQPRRNQQ